MKNKIYVVEDMAMARASLIDKLEDENFEVVGSAANAEIAWSEMQNLEIDLALLDINLAGEKDGVWLAEKIREKLNIAIVFLTAYGDNTTIQRVTATNPNGFLMKPFNKPSLLTTVNIALKAFGKEVLLQSTDNLFVIIEVKGQKVKLYLKEILFLQSNKNYLEIHLQNEVYTVRAKLNYFLDNLPNNNNIRQVHLRFAVNVDKISVINVTSVLIKNTKIPVSKTYKNSFI